ncbi:MAG TPA: ATP-binding cassette domain-containing protein [Chitinophagales bacterium]|nr:ATP-binding cassette domain-containing protein [Chitinophagales bacterium]
MLRTSTITFTYDNKRIFNYPEVNCNKGDQLLIYGKSGSGKSTLLHLLAGLIQPDNGHIFIDDVDITQLKHGNLDQYRGQKIGFIPQRLHLIPSLDVRDNIVAACYFADKKLDTDRLDSISDTLEIYHLLGRRTKSLSLGEQQRVCIARAIINAPAILFADEPTSSLDDTNTENVMKLLNKACSLDNSSLVVVTHDIRIKNKIDHQIALS